MIVTKRDARRIIQAAYGPTFKFKITKGCSVGVRPVYQTTVGMHTLAWRKLDAAPESAVAIGRMHSGGSIDWGYVPPAKAYGICQWFALCDQAAVTAVTHPILGAVPCCQRHADFATEVSL